MEAELEAEVEVDKSEVEISGVFVGMVAAEVIATTIERMVNIFMIGFQHYGIGCYGEKATGEVMSMFPLIELLFPSNKFVCPSRLLMYSYVTNILVDVCAPIREDALVNEPCLQVSSLTSIRGFRKKSMEVPKRTVEHFLDRNRNAQRIHL